MGIFDFLTGSDSTQTQTVETVENQKVKDSTIQGSTQTGISEKGTVAASEKSETQSQVVDQSFLDSEIQSLLGNLIRGIGVNAGSAPAVNPASPLTANQDLLGVIQQRAIGLPQTIDEKIAGIIGEARRSGESQLTSAVSNTARSAGSAQNSLVADVNASGRAELETRLAGLQGQLGLAGVDATERALASAFAAGDTQTKTAVEVGDNPVNQIAQLAQILKGATATGTTQATGQSSQVAEEQQTAASIENLISVLERLQEGTTTRSSSGTTTGSSTGSILDILNTVSRFIPTGT
jgi:hypothetical protein